MIYTPDTKKAMGLRCQALLDDPNRFAIAGFEVFYSKQEQELLRAIQIKLLPDDTDRPGDIADPWYTGDFQQTREDILRECRAPLREQSKR